MYWQVHDIVHLFPCYLQIYNQVIDMENQTKRPKSPYPLPCYLHKHSIIFFQSPAGIHVAIKLFDKPQNWPSWGYLKEQSMDYIRCTQRHWQAIYRLLRSILRPLISTARAASGDTWGRLDGSAAWSVHRTGMWGCSRSPASSGRERTCTERGQDSWY